MEKLYKVLDGDRSMHGGSAVWDLPVKNADGTWTPGAWMPDIVGDLALCANGYHLCRRQDLVFWLGPDLYEIEIGDEWMADNEPPETKIVSRRARLLRKVETWNDETGRAFARWCALGVSHLWDMPDVVRRYLETGDESLRAAAWDAANAAANAARAAACAARAAANAAANAARAAANAAAWAAACAAAWAAWDAANAAAWAAAWDAARAAQTEKLFEMLGE